MELGEAVFNQQEHEIQPVHRAPHFGAISVTAEAGQPPSGGKMRFKDTAVAAWLAFVPGLAVVWLQLCHMPLETLGIIRLHAEQHGYLEDLAYDASERGRKEGG